MDGGTAFNIKCRLPISRFNIDILYRDVVFAAVYRDRIPCFGSGSGNQMSGASALTGGDRDRAIFNVCFALRRRNG